MQPIATDVARSVVCLYVCVCVLALCVLCVSLDHFIPELLACVVLGFVSSVPSQEVGWD